MQGSTSLGNFDIFKETSDLGLQGFMRPACPNKLGKYDIEILC